MVKTDKSVDGAKKHKFRGGAADFRAKLENIGLTAWVAAAEALGVDAEIQTICCEGLCSVGVGV